MSLKIENEKRVTEALNGDLSQIRDIAFKASFYKKKQGEFKKSGLSKDDFFKQNMKHFNDNEETCYLNDNEETCYLILIIKEDQDSIKSGAPIRACMGSMLLTLDLDDMVICGKH